MDVSLAGTKRKERKRKTHKEKQHAQEHRQRFCGMVTPLETYIFDRKSRLRRPRAVMETFVCGAELADALSCGSARPDRREGKSDSSRPMGEEASVLTFSGRAGTAAGQNVSASRAMHVPITLASRQTEVTGAGRRTTPTLPSWMRLRVRDSLDKVWCRACPPPRTTCSPTSSSVDSISPSASRCVGVEGLA